MTTRRFNLGTIGGLKIAGDVTAIIGSVTLIIVLSVASQILLDWTWLQAIVWGVLATAIHFVVTYLHHVGHAIAARRTGYPMQGIQLYLVLGASVYPADEPELSSDTHILRALGGPIFSGLVAVVMFIIAILLNYDSFVGSLVMWAAIDSFVTYVLGALTPLGFTDASTILYWSRRRS